MKKSKLPLSLYVTLENEGTADEFRASYKKLDDVGEKGVTKKVGVYNLVNVVEVSLELEVKDVKTSKPA